MKWVKIDRASKSTWPRVAMPILFCDEYQSYAGWLESWMEEEDPIFYDKMNEEWPEDVTHWGIFPEPPDQ